jgi:hypothetical protein
MHNVVLSPIDPEILIESIAQRVTSNILKKFSEQQLNEGDQWFNLYELCNYLPDKPKPKTVYAWVSAKTIPVHKHKDRKSLRFLKSEVDLWLRQGKRKTETEIAAEADLYLRKRKRGKLCKNITTLQR